MKKRNEIYASFLEKCRKKTATVNDIIHLGFKLMRQEKLHHHFFGDHSFFTIAHYLTYFSLNKNGPYKPIIENISEKEASDIFLLYEKRIAEKIPVEYITQQAYYLGYPFYVNQNVLVPRSVMNTQFNDFLNAVHWKNHRVLDLCTGSGCIGITLARLNPRITVDLADISPQALEVAQINIAAYSLQERVKCIQSDLFDNINAQYDLIISNPPYVTTREYEKSPDEFKAEPKIALEAGVDGLDIIDKILANAKSHLHSNGMLIVETGSSAAARLKKKYPNIKFKWLKYRNPSGKESLFGEHCMFMCNANDL